MSIASMSFFRENDLTNSEETPCTKCSKPAIYRPLVNENGDFLCDKCYKDFFPASAMCDAKSRNGIQRLNPFRLKKDDNYFENLNEDAECRLCLEKGYLRKCCNKFYCHECFRKARQCPGCGKTVHLTGVTEWKTGDSGVFAVAGTWAITIMITLSFLLLVATFTWNELTTPETVWGHKCKGWFSRCNVEVCIDSGRHANIGLPYDYHYCNLESTTNKIFGHICIFDVELYDLSDKALGFDFCQNAPREKDQTLFRNGEYIFEDNFDQWRVSNDFTNKSVGMASARWVNMKNAETSNTCGFNTVYESKKTLQTQNIPQLTQNAALVFSGVHFRFAETKNLDIKYGGMIEFFLKIAPIIENVDNPLCKGAYGGDVTILFSKNNGISWQPIATYPVWKYRGENFTMITETIPEISWSNNTRFRWEQNSFDSSRDYWAIDDVSIFCNFPPDWKNSVEYNAKYALRDINTQEAQCCLRTEQCRQYPHTYLSQEKCNEVTNNYEKSNQFKLRNSDYFVVWTLVVGISKIFLGSLRKWSMALYEKSNHKIIPESNPKQTLNQRIVSFAKKEYTPQRQISWTICMSFILISILALAIFCMVIIYIDHPFYHNFLVEQRQAPKSIFPLRKFRLETAGFIPASFIIYLTSMFLDAKAVLWLLRNVFVVRQKWLPKVEINTYPGFNFLKLNQKEIPLTEVKELELFTAKFCWISCILYAIGGLPFMSLCLIIRSTWAPRKISSPLVYLFGIASILREIFKPDIFMKALLSLQWIFSRSQDARNEMGCALKQKVVIYWIECLAPTTSILFWCIFGTYNRMFFSSISVIVATIGAFVGALIGSIVGILSMLPVVPEMFLTRWPTKGYMIRYNYISKYPCTFSFTSCSTMQTHHRLLVLFLDDMTSFKDLLKGDYNTRS